MGTQHKESVGGRENGQPHVAVFVCLELLPSVAYAEDEYTT